MSFSKVCSAGRGPGPVEGFFWSIKFFRKGLVMCRACFWLGAGPRPIEGVLQECRRASSSGGRASGVQKGLVQWGACFRSVEGPRPMEGVLQECRRASSNGGMDHTSDVLKLCCSAFPYLCFYLIISSIIIIKIFKNNFYVDFCNRYGRWQSMHIYFLFICFYMFL
jgi:hypothetical protein